MDIKKLLSSFNDHKVLYTIIGASAFPAHGFDRATQDIDLFIKPTMKNAEKTWNALRAVGYDVSDLDLKTLLEKKILFRKYILDTDIHPFVAGVTWKRVWKNKIRGVCEGVRVNIASLDDLIRMKKAAGRPKDIEDLRYLEKIKKIKKKKRKSQAPQNISRYILSKS